MVFLKLPLIVQPKIILVRVSQVKTLNNIFIVIENLLKNTQIFTTIAEIMSQSAQITNLLSVRIQILITFYPELLQTWLMFIDQVIYKNNLKFYLHQTLFTPLATHTILIITKHIMSHSAPIQIISTH